ncbi:hypothetical protein TWF481_011234 [Arthrobotrys musiformis]|uniref:Telomeric single stranded DNA binding POT1/Cdc13 domain-containing protein n=1 Tax=Arthrobotrys musiformis TaxID=47236 RepID=A0AAV9VXQ1_9PEZI
MDTIPGLAELEPISLASLEPSVSPKSEITATVASLWPYSSSALKLTAIIVESDYQKRENRGELKVSFHGYAAESLKTLAIGNVVKISLEGATWEELPDPEERDVPWQLKWEKRLRVRVFKDISAKELRIEVDKTFDQAHRSGIFDRIAAAEAIINESQLEQDEDEDLGGLTPPKHSQPANSWSTSFRDSTAGDSQTPINIFAQGRRRLFSLGSDDEEDDIDADRMRKRPRLFEPHQSFRYVSDSPGDTKEEEEEEVKFAKRTEDQFFDENSFRESFRGKDSASTPRLYVRPDDAGDVSIESQSQRSALGDKPRGSKLYVRPDDSQVEGGSGPSTQPMTPQTTEDHETKRRTADMDDEIFQIIFGQQSEPRGVSPHPEEEVAFRDSLAEFTSQETFSRQVPLAPQDDSMGHVPAELPTERSTTPPFPIEQSTTPPFPPQKSATPPFTTRESFTPPLPEGLHPVEVESQPMSSFTLDASQASRPVASEMPPPTSQSHPVPRLQTLFSDRFDPITPVLKPTASPALPLPSPFPSSALERGSVSFFPSRLSQSFTGSDSQDTPIKNEDEEQEAPATILETASAAIEQLEGPTQIKREEPTQIKQEDGSQGADLIRPNSETVNDQSVRETVEVARETITVVEHASSLADPESPRQLEKPGKAENRPTKADQPVIKASQPEVIEILDSSDEEVGEEDGEYDEEDEEEEDEEDEDEDEDEDEEYEEDDEYPQEGELDEDHADLGDERGFQRRYKEALAAESDEDDQYIEDDEYPREGELDDTHMGEDEGADRNQEWYGDEDEEDMRHRYQPTPSPDIEERESPFVSDDEEPSPKVGESPIPSRSPISYISPSHRTVGAEVAVPPSSTYGRRSLTVIGTSALRGSMPPRPHEVASLKSPALPIARPTSHIHPRPPPSPSTKSTVRPSLSPEPYVPESPSSSPSRPHTPNQAKQADIQTPALKDNNSELIETPINRKSSLWMGAQDSVTSQSKKKRVLPWLTPQVGPKYMHHKSAVEPSTVPDKLRTPAADTRTAIEEMIKVAKKLRSQDPVKKPILKPKLDINPDAIRRFREYNNTCGVSGGVITSLSEFVPLQTLLKIEWEKTVDLLAVNLREGAVAQYEKQPKFFELKVWLIDPSCGNGKAAPVILVRPYEPALPKTVKPGDVILLRNIKIKSQDHQRCGFSTMTSSWKLWRPRRAPDGQQQMVSIPHEGPNPEFGAEEVAYVNRLWEWWKGIDVDIRVYLINKKNGDLRLLGKAR